MKGKFILSMIARTYVGRVYEVNEDHHVTTINITGKEWYVPDGAYRNAISGSLMAIADGKGGSGAGEIASRIAIDSIKEYFQSLDKIMLRDMDILTILRKSILYSH